MQLTSENYYSQEANKEYMSVSGYKDFAGTYGKMPCEFYGMEKLNGRWEDEKSTALLVGSYVDSYFEGSLEQFKKDNPEIFTQKGELKANFKQAEEIIARIERDEYFMKYMSGQKQVIMTGELFGAKWKIKMDSYIPGVAIVDLKVMASITDLKWVKDIGYLDFVRYWGYDIQGAVYQDSGSFEKRKEIIFMSHKIIKPEGIELIEYLNNGYAICNRCGAVMRQTEDPKTGCGVYICPSCGLKVDEEDYEYESDEEVEWTEEMLDMEQGDIPPAGCRACGGPYPYCKTSCKLFDD